MSQRACSAWRRVRAYWRAHRPSGFLLDGAPVSRWPSWRPLQTILPLGTGSSCCPSPTFPAACRDPENGARRRFVETPKKALGRALIQDGARAFFGVSTKRLRTFFRIRQAAGKVGLGQQEEPGPQVGGWSVEAAKRAIAIPGAPSSKPAWSMRPPVGPDVRKPSRLWLIHTFELRKQCAPETAEIVVGGFSSFGRALLAELEGMYEPESLLGFRTSGPWRAHRPSSLDGAPGIAMAQPLTVPATWDRLFLLLR